jgi:protein-tyrosine phosphatase
MGNRPVAQDNVNRELTQVYICARISIRTHYPSVRAVLGFDRTATVIVEESDLFN